MKSTLTIALSALILASCQSHTTEKTGLEHSIPSEEHAALSVLYTQQAAEYRALCYQAYNMASFQLIQKVASNPQMPAVVLDVDETILDNSPYMANQVKNDSPFSPESWAEWVALKQAAPVPGVSEFLNLADSLGVALFYVSNRDTSMVEATLENMQALGMPQTERSHFYFKSNTSDKHERRSAIRDLGYNILLFVGDNLGDYKSEWDKPTANPERRAKADMHRTKFGEDFIMLPNTMYGTWLGGIYNFERGLTDSAQYSHRLNALEGI